MTSPICLRYAVTNFKILPIKSDNKTKFYPLNQRVRIQLDKTYFILVLKAHCNLLSVLNNVVSWKKIYVNTLRLIQNGHHFTDDTFKRIFLNKNVKLFIEISLKFFPKGIINSIPALVQIMAWRRPGDKPLSEPMMVNLLTHIWVTLPQCVKSIAA